VFGLRGGALWGRRFLGKVLLEPVEKLVDGAEGLVAQDEAGWSHLKRGEGAGVDEEAHGGQGGGGEGKRELPVRRGEEEGITGKG
jgi:hypothetical protein